jgi:hypothetical protein
VPSSAITNLEHGKVVIRRSAVHEGFNLA